MNGTTYKRCGCRDAAGKRLGQRCPKLRRGTGWNPNHGVWQYQIDLPPAADGRRRPLRRGTYASQTEAEAVLGRIRDALAIAKAGEPADLTKVGDLIEFTLKHRKPLPTPAEVRRLLHLGDTVEIPTVEVWLTTWLARAEEAAGQSPRRPVRRHRGAQRADRDHAGQPGRGQPGQGQGDAGDQRGHDAPHPGHPARRAQRRDPAGLHRRQPRQACRALRWLIDPTAGLWPLIEADAVRMLAADIDLHPTGPTAYRMRSTVTVKVRDVTAFRQCAVDACPPDNSTAPAEPYAPLRRIPGITWNPIDVAVQHRPARSR